MAKALHWVAVAGALCSMIGFLRAELIWLAVLEALCGTGLVAGLALKKSRLASAAGLVLIIQTLIIGAIWPSAVTIAALVVAPAFFLAVRYLVKNSPSGGMLLYIAASTGLAAWAVAAEAWVLATVQRV